MSEKLPRLTASEVVSVIERAGFSLARQRGSHRIYKNAAGKRITVPWHEGKILHPKLLSGILADAELSVERLREMMR
jgi:predicted RNA binding protein YcfA (HicA-like mRNA interferase family)